MGARDAGAAQKGTTMLIHGWCPYCRNRWLKTNGPAFATSSDTCPTCGKEGWPNMAPLLCRWPWADRWPV